MEYLLVNSDSGKCSFSVCVDLTSSTNRKQGGAADFGRVQPGQLAWVVQLWFPWSGAQRRTRHLFLQGKIRSSCC